MSNLIIIDRKRKRVNLDNQWQDPLGVDEARKEKARTIDIPNDSRNPVHEFLRQWHSPKFLLGKKCYCLTDRKEIMSGWIVDVIPPYYLLLKNKGVARFSDCVSIEE